MEAQKSIKDSLVNTVMKTARSLNANNALAGVNTLLLGICFQLAVRNAATPGIIIQVLVESGSSPLSLLPLFLNGSGFFDACAIEVGYVIIER